MLPAGLVYPHPNPYPYLLNPDPDPSPSPSPNPDQAELERSTWHRPPPPRAPVARQQAFRIRGDAAGPILVSNLDPDLVADLRATGLSMEEICVQLGIEQ